MTLMWPLKIVEKANLAIFNDLPLRHTIKINTFVQSFLDFGDFWDRAKLTSPKSKSPKSRLYVCNKWAQELTK